MNKFIRKIIQYSLGAFLFLSIFILLAVKANYNHKKDYPAALIDKYKRLDSLKNISKIIICGGSSSSYSINSTLLSKEFNLPVINTSLAMSLGSKFHLNMVKDYIKKDDIIIYIPEYEFYYGNEYGDDFLHTTFFYYPRMFKDFVLDQKKDLILKIVRLSFEYYYGAIKKMGKNKKPIEPQQYIRAAYNFIGDNISLLNVEKSKIKKEKKNRYQKLKNNKLSKKFIDFVIEYKKTCSNKGATFLMTFPPVEKSQYDSRFSKDILEIPNFPYFGSPLDYVYDVSFFYDSSYHLNGLGRKIRTKKIIKTLKEKI